MGFGMFVYLIKIILFEMSAPMDHGSWFLQ